MSATFTTRRKCEIKNNAFVKKEFIVTVKDLSASTIGECYCQYSGETEAQTYVLFINATLRTVVSII
jgi:hypothetical protein